MRAPFIGLGTGRCGTNSLTEILDSCERVGARHESVPTPWYEADENLGKLIMRLKRAQKEDVVAGEIACQLLPHVPALRDPIPDLKIICLHRPRAEVIRSSLENLRCLLRPVNRHRNEWARLYPIIDALDDEQAWGFWWDYYEAAMSKIPQPVFHMEHMDLNDDAKLRALFNFLEIPEADQVFLEHRRYGRRRFVIPDEFKTEKQMVDAKGPEWWARYFDSCKKAGIKVGRVAEEMTMKVVQ